MFKLAILVVIFIMAIYYIDIIAKIIKAEKKGEKKYEGCRAFVPFGYWIFPLRKKKKKKSKSKSDSKTNLKKAEDEKK